MDSMQNMKPSFFDLWSPGIFLVTIILAVFYFYLAGTKHHRFANSSAINLKQKFYFGCGLVIFYAALGSPINFYGHNQLFSAHMLQQSLLYFIMPPLFYLAIPEWLIQPLLQNKWMKKWVYPTTHPFLTLIAFNLLLSFYHFPIIFDFISKYTVFHNGSHIILLIAAFYLWFPIFSPQEWERLSSLQKLAYIFANGVLLTPACALIIFSGSVIYKTYAHAPLLISFLPPLEDQRLGGIIMKITQEMVFGTMLAYVFFSWFRKQKDDDYEPAKI